MTVGARSTASGARCAAARRGAGQLPATDVTVVAARVVGTWDEDLTAPLQLRLATSWVVVARGASGGAGPAVAREFAQRGDAVALLAPGEAGLQGAGFVLAVDGMIVTAVYSFGAIGRLMADDVVGLVCYIKQQP